MLGIPLAVVGDEQIQQPVVVVIDPGGGYRPHFLAGVSAAAHAGLRRHIGKRAIAVVVEELVAVDVGDEDVGPAVVIIVADGNAHAVTGAGQPGLFGDVGERQVAVVVEQAVAELRAVLGEPGHGAAVDEVDIEQAVAVVIEQATPATMVSGCSLAAAGAVEG
jgi:hypothetical protein